MHAWDNPPDREPTRTPPGSPGSDLPDEREPGRDQQPEVPRRPEPDPEAQRAPGADDDGTSPGPPPMQADDERLLDGPGMAREPIGNDNIVDGTVGGVMGPAHATNGQGQGG